MLVANTPARWLTHEPIIYTITYKSGTEGTVENTHLSVMHKASILSNPRTTLNVSAKGQKEFYAITCGPALIWHGLLGWWKRYYSTTSTFHLKRIKATMLPLNISLFCLLARGTAQIQSCEV